MADCIFCKIINKEIPSKTVFEDEDIIIFHDISPKAPIHVLAVPKKHMASLNDVNDEDTALLGRLMLKISAIVKKLGIDRSGYKVVANNGTGAGQIVLHLHFHILGGWKEKDEGWKV